MAIAGVGSLAREPWRRPGARGPRDPRRRPRFSLIQREGVRGERDSCDPWPTLEPPPPCARWRAPPRPGPLVEVEGGRWRLSIVRRRPLLDPPGPISLHALAHATAFMARPLDPTLLARLELKPGERLPLATPISRSSLHVIDRAGQVGRRARLWTAVAGEPGCA